MFTGIVEGIGNILQLSPLIVSLPKQLLSHLKTGASVAIDGVCLTVTRLEGEQAYFDLSAETKRLTTLGKCCVGDKVNLERAVKLGDEIGGHLLSGHVCGQVTILQKGDLFLFSCPAEIFPYIFYKGFVALNGVSLTLALLQPDHFGIAFIPETLQRTTFGSKHVGDAVNLEWDMMTYAAAETARRLLTSP